VQRRPRSLLFALALTAAATSACGSSATTSVTATAPTQTRCQPSLTISSSSFGADGGTGAVSIGVARECSWTATTQAAWIQITSSATGQGDGSVAFRVGANADPVTRNSTITVGDQSSRVTQGAAPCRFDVSGPAGAIAASGGQASIDVRTNAVCSWTAASNAPWATVSPASGQGTAEIVLTAATNTGPERTVTLTVAQQQMVVRQMSPPAPAPPAPAPAPAPTPTPTPTPAPPTPTPPPPAPPPPPKVVDFDGKVDHLSGVCPEVAFTADDQPVRANASTTYKKGTCRDLKNGTKVSGSGTMVTAAGSSYVLAQSIEIQK
jgi:hypothetical protein